MKERLNCGLNACIWHLIHTEIGILNGKVPTKRMKEHHDSTTSLMDCVMVYTRVESNRSRTELWNDDSNEK